MSEATFEILTAQEFAQRLKVKTSWVVDASQPARNADPIPVMKMGRHNRYAWICPAMAAWFKRRGLK
jgi:hypothetical protein